MDKKSKAKVAFIFVAVKEAEVKITDLAKLTGIRRETLHRWKNGANVTDELRLNIAYKTASLIAAACREGKLPLVNKMKAPQRMAALRTIIRNSSRPAK